MSSRWRLTMTIVILPVLLAPRHTSSSSPSSSLVMVASGAFVAPPHHGPSPPRCHVAPPGEEMVRSRTTRRRRSVRLHLDGKGMASGGGNGAKHLVGDVLRALEPRYLKQVADAVAGRSRGPSKVDTSDLIDGGAPTWEELSTILRKSQTTEERGYREDLKFGRGPPSARANLRLFDGDAEPRVVLYRDSAAWCPYCQKVWIALEERRVSYRVERIDMRCYGVSKPSEFTKLQSNGNLPCAVVTGDDGTTTVLNESDDIIDAIDGMGSPGTPRLRPPEGTDEAELTRRLCDDGRKSLERRLYADWMWYLTGVRRPDEYRRNYDATLDEVEDALSSNKSGPYFLGRDVSLADIRFAPFVERQVASLAYFKGYDFRTDDEARRRRPNLVRWMDAMESRPAYRCTKSDYYTHSRALPPQLASECSAVPEGESLRLLIDDLPLGDAGDTTAPSDGWVEAGWGWADGGDAARREAAERVVHNHENIVRFASRGAGTPGLPASSAPLADPRATPNDGAAPAVDVMLRHAVAALLRRGGRGRRGDADEGARETASSLDGESRRAVASCLDYLRGRVGVPRDMSYPAARELRGELRDLSGALLDGVDDDGAAAVAAGGRTPKEREGGGDSAARVATTA